MKIYLIPGLGYDCRIFQKLNVGNLDAEGLNWIEPNGNESIRSYANRLFKNINDQTEEVVLIGHSLGGIIAQQIATVKRVNKVVLISSIKSSDENPWFFKIISPLNLHKLFTKELSIKTVKFWGKNHGLETPETQELFKSMLEKQSNSYLQWALKTLSEWKPEELPPRTKLIQLHGSHDKTFPLKFIDKPNHVIENAGHFMVYKKANLINKLLVEELLMK